MPQVLNFDTLTYDTVEITKRGRTWNLRDDVPTKIIMRCFDFATLQERLQQATKDAEAAHPDDLEGKAVDLRDRYAKEERRAANIVGDIFRHTDPNITDDDLLAVFSMEDLQKVAQLFFTLHSQRLNPPQDATSAPSTATVATSQKKSRAQRRASAKRS